MKMKTSLKDVAAWESCFNLVNWLMLVGFNDRRVAEAAEKFNKVSYLNRFRTQLTKGLA